MTTSAAAFFRKARTVMGKLSKTNRGKLIDILSERLAFERSGVKLYDRVLTVLRAQHTDDLSRLIGKTQEYRDQEKEHEEWLEALIRDLGGTAHEETERSRLVTRESQGIEAVVKSEERWPNLFHALVAAELVDNAGWELLVGLADQANDREVKREFKRRLHEEEEHLLFVRKVVETLSIQDVLEGPRRLPASELGALLS
jgi:bacterioferritin (cytochrome b1)